MDSNTSIQKVISDNIWEKLPDESTKAYSAFSIYLKLDPYNRSIVKAVKEKTGYVKPSTLRVWQRWSSKYSWVARASAWDEETERLARKKKLEELEQMEDRHIKVAQAIQQKAIERLKIMDAGELTVTDILRFFFEGAKLERLTRGVPGEISKTYDLILETKIDYTELTDEQLREKLAKNMPPVIDV